MYMGIDSGTSSVKVILLDEGGALVAEAAAPLDVEGDVRDRLRRAEALGDPVQRDDGLARQRPAQLSFARVRALS